MELRRRVVAERGADLAVVTSQVTLPELVALEIPACKNTLPGNGPDILPSVSGEAEARLLLRIMWLPSPMARLQRMEPSDRSSATSRTLSLEASPAPSPPGPRKPSSAEVTKT
jgi:hypothetical protein